VLQFECSSLYAGKFWAFQCLLRLQNKTSFERDHKPCILYDVLDEDHSDDSISIEVPS
jgi:hypothetical protein